MHITAFRGIILEETRRIFWQVLGVGRDVVRGPEPPQYNSNPRYGRPTMSYFNSSRSEAKPSRTTGFGESLPNFGDVRSKLHNKPDLTDRFRKFSPSAKKSAEEILHDLKDQLRSEGDMFFSNTPPDWSYSPKSSMFSKVSLFCLF